MWLLLLLVLIYIFFTAYKKLKESLVDNSVRDAVGDFNYEQERKYICSILEKYGFNNRRCKRNGCDGLLVRKADAQGTYLACRKCFISLRSGEGDAI